MHGKLSVVDFYQQKEAYVLRMSNTNISKIEIVASDTYRVSPDLGNLVFILPYKQDKWTHAYLT